MSATLVSATVRAPATKPSWTAVVSQPACDAVSDHSRARAGATADIENQSPMTRSSAAASRDRVRHLSLIRAASILAVQLSGTNVSVVGTSVPRKDGAAKVGGTAKYVDDITLPGMLYGRTIRATIPSGRLAGVRLDFDTAGFTIVDYRDIPGRNIIALIEDDQPCLVEREIRHVAEAVILLAHEDREKLLQASVVLEYERTEPVFDPERSPKGLKQTLIEKGNP